MPWVPRGCGGSAQSLEASVLKLHAAWRRLGDLRNDSGWKAATARACDVLTALQSLSGVTMRVSLGELAGGKRVRLQIVEESPDQLDPPPMG